MTIQPIKQVLVYNDEGVNSESALGLKNELQNILDRSILVSQVGSDYIKNEPWEKRTIAVAFGGGVCSKWDENLGLEGMQKVRNYIYNGGTYIGTCAAAYWVATESFFSLTNQAPLIKKRPMPFFEGRAVGPIIDVEDYKKLSAACALKVSCTINEKRQSGHFYYQGGCSFEIDESDPKIDVVARYLDILPGKVAAMTCKVGNGKAFLSGLHPEFSSPQVGENAPSPLLRLAKTLSKEETFRSDFWQEIGHRLDLPLKRNSL